ncbi:MULTISPECIES: hypothetical protein [unclassified Streptomyces]|uniref:hypothetical protein n=1 Tax=unclassified Streptomyces TaxID=2593676 RepID=UPI00035E4702|nr:MULTISPECIES: hypothetical protein [unclassified Streptomyces]MYX39034.1 hypothetical protein [Streptomyces sp. SID8377]
MSDETPNPRYFTKEGESVQVVYNLRDATPYFDLGYEEVDEAAYLASLPAPANVSTVEGD